MLRGVLCPKREGRGEQKLNEKLMLHCSQCQQGGAGRRYWGVGLGLGARVCHDPGYLRSSGSGHGCFPYRTGSPGSGKAAAKASTSSFSAFSSLRYFSSSSFSLNSFSVAFGFMSFCTRSVSSIPARMADASVSPHSCNTSACARTPRLSQPCCREPVRLGCWLSPAPPHSSAGAAPQDVGGTC